MVSYNSGNTWQKRATGIPACGLGPFYFVDSLNGCCVWVRPVPNNAAVDLIRPRDGGDTWTALSVSIPICAGAKIYFLDTLNGWMWHCDPQVSMQYRFSRTQDGGLTRDSLSTFNNAYDLWFYTFEALDSAHFWLAGYKGFNATVLFSYDGGRSWTEQMPGVGDDIVGFDAVDSNHAYAVGAIGYVYIYSPPLIGDLNLDWTVNLTDIVLSINYIFFGQATAVPSADMDFDADCVVDIVDAVLLINFVFSDDSQLQWGCTGS